MALKAGEGLQRWEIAVTKKLVGEFRRRSRSLAREEFDDLMQECLAHWIVVRRKLAPDPDAPPVGYMAQVIRNKLTDLIREREADKRAGEKEALSLDAALDGSDVRVAQPNAFDFLAGTWPDGSTGWLRRSYVSASGGGHFIVASGTEDDGFVWVSDPGGGTTALVAYNTLRTAYRGSGTWTHSYFTRA